ncbi:MAG: type I-A CRISPR-associated protein Cas4/Csa1 [Candidatus Methanofastidiosia archaeon]
MYFLGDMERKYLLGHLLKVTREVGVSDELRGWSWHKEPLKPYYEVKLPMYVVSSKYCKSARDVYLKYVERKKGEITYEMSLGIILHDVVSQVFSCAKNNFSNLDFKNFWEKRKKEVIGNPEVLKNLAEKIWDFCVVECKASYLRRETEQPYASNQDIVQTALPFLIEHKISGEFLGLSEILSIDCYDYLHGIMFDLKHEEKNEKNRLYPTGYALVFESVYEIPVDVGCITYVNFRNERLLVDKDMFHINDNLRSWWVEERDKKFEIVLKENDPGKPENCPRNCMYYGVCW